MMKRVDGIGWIFFQAGNSKKEKQDHLDQLSKSGCRILSQTDRLSRSCDPAHRRSAQAAPSTLALSAVREPRHPLRPTGNPRSEIFLQEDSRGPSGGYCYELNGCFAWLLKRLGFKVSMVSARVAKKEGGFSPDFDHLTLLVRLGERWLVDVGFGDLFTEPKRVDSTDAQQDKGEAYRIVSKGKTRLLLRRSADETTWKPQYAFTLRPRKLADFAERNRYQQTSRRSRFTQGRLTSKLTPMGRVTLTDEKLILTERGKRVEHLVKDQGEFNRLLAKHFKLLLPRRGL